MAGYIGANTSSVTNNQNAAERRKKFTFTANTTVLSGLNFAPEKIHIFHNGIRLVRTTDYVEASDGKSVTLVNAAQAGDEVVAVTFAQDPASNAGYTDADVDAHLLTAGVTLDAANDRVGVNTATPSEALEVDGVIQIDRTGDHPAMRFVEDGSNTRAYLGSGDWAVNGLANDDFGISSSSTGDLVLGTAAGTERLRIDNTGRVTTPSQPSFSVRSNAGNSGNTWQQNNVIKFQTVQHNVGSHYSTTTGRFTAPINGFYVFHYDGFGYNGGQIAAGYTVGVSLRINGSNFVMFVYDYNNGSSGYPSSTGTVGVYLTANDYVEIYTTSQGQYADSSNLYTHWSGYLLH